MSRPRRTTVAGVARRARLVVVSLSLILVAACADGRKSPPTLPASRRTQPATFVVIGGRESTGSGLADPLHTAWTQLLFGRRLPVGTVYVNAARDDDTVAQALREQVPLAIEQRPTLAVVWLGEGDDDVGTTTEDFERDMRSLVGQLRRGGRTQVLVASPPPGVPGARFSAAISAAARSAAAKVVPLSAAAWDPHATDAERVAVQAAAADELGRAIRP